MLVVDASIGRVSNKAVARVARGLLRAYLRIVAALLCFTLLGFNPCVNAGRAPVIAVAYLDRLGEFASFHHFAELFS